MTLTSYVTIGAIIATLISSGSVTAALASALGRSDFDDHPERFCAGFGPSNEDLCADLDICDDEGEINNTHGYCTGEIVPHREYPPWWMPCGISYL